MLRQNPWRKTLIPKATTASTPYSVGMLTSNAASPSRWPACGERDRAGAHQRKRDDLHRRLEGGEAVEIEPVPHHRWHEVQPVHQHERAKRHDRVAQPADRGECQRRQRQQRVNGDIRLDDRAADAGAWNFRHVAEQGRHVREPVEGFDGGNQDEEQIKPEQARRADRRRGPVIHCGGGVHSDRNRFG